MFVNKFFLFIICVMFIILICVLYDIFIFFKGFVFDELFVIYVKFCDWFLKLFI